MRCRLVAGCALAFLLVSAAGSAEPPAGLLTPALIRGDEPGADEEQKPYWYKITVPATPPTSRPLAYPLQIDPIDAEPGNAALLWIRAGQLARQVKQRITEKDEVWSGSVAFGGTPLDKLPKDKVAKLLEPFQPALRVAHQAALRTSCDWGDPPLTLANLNDHLPLDEIQSLRELARLLCFEHRLALANGDWREANRVVRTGLTMARHLGESNLLIAHLVGIAIEAILMGRLEEALAQPGAPNLYWSLTDLPQPLVDIRKAVRYELNTFHRSFPELRKLERDPEEPLAQGQLLAMFAETLRGFQPTEGVADWQKSLMLTAMVGRYYPAAKQALLDRGVAADKVEKLPTAQVVGLYFLNDYNSFRDDVLKLQNLPPWQARPFVDAIEKRVAARTREGGNPFLLLFPAVAKVEHASLRSVRTVAVLRTVEAVRLHAAHNRGELPAKLADITVAAVPLDPATGKTFEAFYRREGGVAKLEVPPLPPLQAHHARHFEFVSPAKEKP